MEISKEIVTKSSSDLSLEDTTKFRWISKIIEGTSQELCYSSMSYDCKDKEKYQKEILNKFNSHVLQGKTEESLRKIFYNINKQYQLLSSSSDILVEQHIQRFLLEKRKTILDINDKTPYEKFLFLRLSDSLRSDEEVVMAALKKDVKVLQYASEELKINRTFILEVVKQIGYDALRYASKDFRTDKEFILEGIKQYCYEVFEYNSEDFWNDREFVLDAIKYNSYVLRFIPEFLKSDKAFFLKIIELKGCRILRYASKSLRSDEEFMLEAVKLDPYALEYASEILKSNKDFILKAVRQNGYDTCPHCIDIYKDFS